MDNRLLNVNGRTKEQLTLALALAFKSEYNKDVKAVGWRVTNEHGLILFEHAPENREGYNSFIVPHTPEQCATMIWDWVNSPDAKNIELSDWCGNIDHDGHNRLGWQVYLENWGKVAGEQFVICAAKPAYCWYGK
tara:strand:- start:200005 stop:200409 length:405 start_codon:yes stop_codon:yes gene_type:complete